MEQCRVCGSCSKFFSKDKRREYRICEQCNAIFVPEKLQISSQEEFERYLKHQNNSDDKGYVQFLSPIVTYIEKNIGLNQTGLDFGSGPSKVLTQWLQKLGYKIDSYDPFFDPNTIFGEESYDFVIACEVIEHFRQPKNEFRRINQILKKGGKLICRTSIFSSDIDFGKWYYKNDKTHFIFYQEKTLKMIQNLFGFTSLISDKPLIIFTK